MNIKNILHTNKVTIGLVIVAFILGSWFTGGDSTQINTNSTGNHNSHSTQAQTWTCSMHPNVQLPEAGQCPICFMDLIPLEGSGGGLSANQLSMSEDAVKLANIETVAISYGKAEMAIQLSGKVVYDESRIGNITAWVPGRVERMFVDYTGITVNKGDHMIELYSPDLYAAQEELIQA
ncbi:MAG: efflux RND transporter periplasmic adaptor subunit, partial [Candidatus Marinimicrobia bacterium]|nr:efflux RND transporter periplasmic adaptor subunit [Candidatus Neomarinimicrobiota bacterium]